MSAGHSEHSQVWPKFDEGSVTKLLELRIAFVPYGRRERGSIGNVIQLPDVGTIVDGSRFNPRWQAQNAAATFAGVESAREIDAEPGATPAPVASAAAFPQARDRSARRAARHIARLEDGARIKQ